MDPEYWLKRWENNDIGFHQGDFHPLFTRELADLELEHFYKVFVPLCGKSKDMLWFLQQGCDVVGIEVSELAIQQFARENDLAFEVKQEFGMKVYRGERISLCCGDFFQLNPRQVAGVDLIYDRAALVALPEALRKRYCQSLTSLFDPHPALLLVTMEYDAAKMDGPPFSVSDKFVRENLASYDLNLISEIQVTDAKHLRARGLDTLVERVYLAKSHESGACE